MKKRTTSHSSTGFTLVELVVTIAISSIVVGFVATFLTAPVDAYIDQTERADITDSAQIVAHRLEEDLRSALPNSVRIRNSGSRSIIEFLLVKSVSFYRQPGELGNNPDRELIFTALGDDRFSAFGQLPVPLPTDFLVIGNKGTGNGSPSLDAYIVPGSRVITSTATSIQIAPGPTPFEQSVTLSPSFRFAATESRNRMFLISGPVSYICNSAANARSLRRYQNYAITPGIPVSESSPQLLVAGLNTLLASDVSSCALRCVGGNNNICDPTIVIEFTVRRVTASGDESVEFFAQFPLDNIS
jgi:MSHA biogenesis protein MshO